MSDLKAECTCTKDSECAFCEIMRELDSLPIPDGYTQCKKCSGKIRDNREICYTCEYTELFQ